jgi:hypothetical protein
MVARIGGNDAHDGTERESRGIRIEEDGYSLCSDFPAVQHHHERNPIRLARLDRFQIPCGLRSVAADAVPLGHHRIAGKRNGNRLRKHPIRENSIRDRW